VIEIIKKIIVVKYRNPESHVHRWKGKDFYPLCSVGENDIIIKQ
jgi:hypothetical protein